MKSIIKSAEPDSLTRHRASPFSDYGNYHDKETLRLYLSDEQRGICCYCLSRIRPVLGEMKIEHWHSQAGHAIEQLHYSNLLGACMGNEGQVHSDQHCDTFKGNRDLSRNPANPMHRVEEFVRYESSGKVSSNDPVFDAELDKILNLNVPILVNNRRAVLNSFIKMLKKRGSPSKAKRRSLLEDWNGERSNGELKPFGQVVVYWLLKHERR